MAKGRAFALLLGMAAGAALTAFAVTSQGKRVRSVLVKRVNSLDETLSTIKDTIREVRNSGPVHL